MSDFFDKVGALSPTKRRLLELYLKEQMLSRPPEQDFYGPPLQRISRAGELPLSFAQQRLWFLDRLMPRSPAYNIPSAMRLSGPLDVAALAQSLNAVVERQETLRTTFAAAHGQPVQVIAPALTLTLPVVDLRALPPLARLAETRRRAVEEVQQPFDLSRGPLLRARLLQLDQARPEPGRREEHMLLLTMHHTIADGWSIGVLLQEVTALYAAFVQGHSPPLPELPIQYADFAVWQRQWLQGQVLDRLLSYWQQQLASVPTLELPTDRPRPAVQTFRGARQTLELPQRLTEALKALSQQHKVTLYVALLAAFKVLLHRYTGQEDVTVGSPIANRQRAETERLIGFFVNTLVLRTRLEGNPAFSELLARLREVVVQAHAHQALPFERLVEKLQVERDLSRTPLFQVMFILQNVQMRATTLPGLTLNPWPVDSGIAKFDLTLEMVETAHGLRATAEYNTDLLDAVTVRRLLSHYERLLATIVTQADQRISRLPLLTDAEQQQLLAEYNDTRVTYQEETCVHQLFEAQAERTPDAVAAIFAPAGSGRSESQHITYQELNRQANQLAHHLQKLGVGPETLVGICTERSPEMMVELLGVLKAGGAYAPLEPAYPRERLAFMLTDTQAPVLLTRRELAANLSTQGARVVCLDADQGAIAQESEENPGNVAGIGNLAYVIYTSGSTGKPKGVQILHRALTNFLRAVRRQPALTTQDILLAVTTLSFDIAALELYLPLTVGACVALVGREEAANGVQLASILADANPTAMQATPATWRLVLEAGWTGRPGPKVLCGGEALPRELADQLQDRVGSLWNMYGPTETTVWSALHEVARQDGPVPIGRPLANTQLYLLDAHLYPAPIGVPGELYIGGDGLARGYLNRPGLVAEKFVPHPFSRETGARLYKTGDLARYLPDGNVEFLGRIDHQIKLRGFRIELGEVEAVLGQHPAVQENVVVAREDASAGKRLVAYLVARQEPRPTSSELRRFLKEKLPDYMVPAAFVTLEALPLTPNGKVDRRALPAPDQTRPTLEAGFVAPRTPTEKALADIWGEVLELDRVGVHDDFFELGGYSMQAIQVVFRVLETFQDELPLGAFELEDALVRALYEEHTVAALAGRVEMFRQAAQGWQAPSEVLTGDREEGEL